MQNVNDLMAEELTALGLAVDQLDATSQAAVSAIAPVLDAAIAPLADNPEALRVVAAALRSYARVAEVAELVGTVLWSAAEHVQADRNELEDLRRYKREHFGLTCRRGHHTRNADLVGHPDDEDWQCSHCVRLAAADR
ncbi:MAG TPA: hypothetical protein VK735_18755 [Pseudonocardia sp.]|uniref:hypothetical protein n=1 Tax=Pseudonocardia sp. TaxID=60912 RepID=UPI002B869A20|nr:hypothetical protein [Pseudonocardia sp.]HTF49488.1 hypothetical protein [Pseudonocardia sp.]